MELTVRELDRSSSLSAIEHFHRLEREFVTTTGTLLSELKTGVSADWKISRGGDKSRQLSFFADSEDHIDMLKEKLLALFRQDNYTAQSAWNAPRITRIAFTFTSPDATSYYAR
jgi:hypothetical protein